MPSSKFVSSPSLRSLQTYLMLDIVDRPAQPIPGSDVPPPTPSLFTRLKSRFVSSPIYVSTYLLFMVYGIGSWVTINGLFSELPLIVDTLPEGWSAASDLTLVIQLANVGPLFYLLFQKHISLRWANVAVLLLGAASMLSLAFTWDLTSNVQGSAHSVALFTLSFSAAICDSTTSLIFWPFVATFHHGYVSALAAGEGLSGFVASVLTWIQNAPSSGHLYSPRVFFIILALLLGLSLASFLLLDRMSKSDPKRIGCTEGQGERDGLLKEGKDDINVDCDRSKRWVCECVFINVCVCVCVCVCVNLVINLLFSTYIY